MVRHQGRINGGVVDDQIQHHLEAPVAGFLKKMLQGRFGVAPIFGMKEGIDAEVIFDRVQAAGEAGGVDGVEINPGKAHACDAVQMAFPPGDGPR